MKINKINIQGFKSIYNSITIDFSDVRGMWKIAGTVGTGKTTIGEAIMYGLFGDIKGKTQVDMVSWGLKKGVIEIWCESRGHQIYINRELRIQGQAILTVEVDGEALVFTNKRDAQQQLENEYYDISKMTLELLCIISFNNFKSIASLNAADTKQFLDQVFGFSILTRYTEVSKLLQNQTQEEWNTLNNKISNLQSQIDSILVLKSKTKVDGDIQETTNKLNEVQAELAKKREVFSKFQTKQHELLREINQKLATIKILGSNKKKEIDFIEKGICPTCGAPIDQSQLELKRQEREVLIEQYTEVNNKYTTEDTKLQSQTKKYNEYNEKILKELQDLKVLLSKLNNQEQNTSVADEEIAFIQQSISTVEDLCTKASKEIAEWNELKTILSTTIRSNVLSNFIPILNKNIAIYLSELHQEYTINFDNEFKCTVTKFGFDKTISIGSLSTGQLKTIDMAIILGVLSIIMHNINFNIIFLDELMSNMDTDLRDSMCELLQSICKENQTVFIISHTDLNEKFFMGSIYTKLEDCGNFRKSSKVEIIKK